MDSGILLGVVSIMIPPPTVVNDMSLALAVRADAMRGFEFFKGARRYLWRAKLSAEVSYMCDRPGPQGRCDRAL